MKKHKLYTTCPTCHKIYTVKSIRGGDGSAMRIRKHNQEDYVNIASTKLICKGSNYEVDVSDCYETYLDAVIKHGVFDEETENCLITMQVNFYCPKCNVGLGTFDAKTSSGEITCYRCKTKFVYKAEVKENESK